MRKTTKYRIITKTFGNGEKKWYAQKNKHLGGCISPMTVRLIHLHTGLGQEKMRWST